MVCKYPQDIRINISAFLDIKYNLSGGFLLEYIDKYTKTVDVGDWGAPAMVQISPMSPIL